MDQGASSDLITKYCGPYIKGTPVAVAAGRARPANVSEILAHMMLGVDGQLRGIVATHVDDLLYSVMV